MSRVVKTTSPKPGCPKFAVTIWTQMYCASTPMTARRRSLPAPINQPARIALRIGIATTRKLSPTKNDPAAMMAGQASGAANG